MFNRKEFITSIGYWTVDIQSKLFRLLTDYMKDNHMNKTQLAEKMGVSKSYVSQILNGNFDFRLSKLVQLALFVGKVPKIEFSDMKDYIMEDQLDTVRKDITKAVNKSVKPEVQYEVDTKIRMPIEEIVNPIIDSINDSIKKM